VPRIAPVNSTVTDSDRYGDGQSETVNPAKTAKKTSPTTQGSARRHKLGRGIFSLLEIESSVDSAAAESGGLGERRELILDHPISRDRVSRVWKHIDPV
jgi:hypothetical protein